MAHKRMKAAPYHLSSGKCKSNQQRDTTPHLFQTLTTPDAGEGVELQELAFIAGGNAGWRSHFGTQAVSYKTEYTLMIRQLCSLVFTERS